MRSCHPAIPSPRPTTGAHRFAVALDTSGTQSITATDTDDVEPHGTESGIAVRSGRRHDADDRRLSHKRHSGHGR